MHHLYYNALDDDAGYGVDPEALFGEEGEKLNFTCKEVEVFLLE
jgi:hypothetical protein